MCNTGYLSKAFIAGRNRPARFIPFLISAVSLLICSPLSSQILDSSSSKHNFFPVVYYLPETSLAFGATGIFTFRFADESSDQRSSQFIYSGAYTLKNQLLLYFPFEMYRKNIRLKGEFGYYRYFYNYYGIGYQSVRSNLENYDVVFPRIEINAAWSLIPKLSLGFGAKFDHFNITAIKEGGLLAQEKPIGYQGGTKMNLLTLAFWDSRDHPFSSGQGIYFETIFQHSVQAFGGDFTYWRWDTDWRIFVPLSVQSVIGIHLLASITSDKTPFFDLPYVSSPKIGRGFADRRYLGHELINIQSEWRFPIKGRFGGTTFVSASKLAGQHESFNGAPILWSYGLGIRFLLNPQELTKLRLDIGRGDQSFNFYFTVNEAF